MCSPYKILTLPKMLQDLDLTQDMQPLHDLDLTQDMQPLQDLDLTQDATRS